jgi:transposase InsO family protein
MFGRRRVARLMRQADLAGRVKKRWRRTTIAGPAAEASRDLIARQFDVGGAQHSRSLGATLHIRQQRVEPCDV